MTATRWLIGAVLTLAVLDLGVRLAQRDARGPELPSIPGFDVAQVTELRLGRVDEPIVVTRAAGQWTISAPVQAAADPVELEAIVSRLAGGVHPDVALPPDAEGYGLSGGSEIRVDVRGAQGDLMSLVIGADAGADGTFVRLPGEETVYRAPIGGRARFDRPIRTLLDRRVASCAAEQISRVVLPGEQAVRRSASGWDGAPVDALAVDGLVRRLCSLRGAEVAAEDRVQDWFATVELEGPDGDISLRFGRSGDLRYVARDGRVWRVTGEWVDRLAQPRAFEDRSLWVAQRVERIVLRGDGRDGELVRNGETWDIRRPANVDVDPVRAQAAATWLARPRVDAWTAVSAAAAGFPSAQTLVVRADGRDHTLEIGAAGAEGTYIRSAGSPERIGRVDSGLIAGLLAIFGS
jgi:Domain of unknown function (DUF4340)